jgi:hypothetical protein
MMHHPSTRRRSRQNGSALLIVFVFAAMIAIMLYKEMPVAAFEAQRQKEQLLMDRGNEYKRAVKLYVRKFQTFPPSIEALENTNRMRFLRNRYVDPYTGKDDWRLLHAGPGGIILDSKVKKPNLLGPGGAPGGSGTPGSPTTSASSSSTFGSPFSSSSFGSSAGFGSSPNANAQPNTATGTGNGFGPNGQPAQAISLPVRPPAISASGGAGEGATPQDAQSTDGQQNPNSGTALYPGLPASYSDTGQSGAPFSPPGAGRFRNGNAMADPNNPGPQPDGTAQDPQAMLQSMLQNQSNPQQTMQAPNGFGSNNTNGTAGNSNTTTSAFGANPQNTQNTGQMGQMGNGQAGGGIAGVASKNTGHTIKVFKDQTDRSLWEFVYDMQAEANANAPGLGNANGTAPNGAINGQQNSQSNQSGFNSTNQNNSFGSTFGNSPTPPATPPPTNQ